jgi:hypothetical protein
MAADVEDLFPACMGCRKMLPGADTPESWGEFSLTITMSGKDWDATLDGELCPDCMRAIPWLAQALGELDADDDDDDDDDDDA